MATNYKRAVSPESHSDEFDSVDLVEIGEVLKSLRVLGKEQLQSPRVSRSLRARELEMLWRENEDLKNYREAELRQIEEQITDLQQLEVCQPRHHAEKFKNYTALVVIVDSINSISKVLSRLAIHAVQKSSLSESACM